MAKPFSGPRDKLLAGTRVEDEAADAPKRMLASQNGQAGLEAPMTQRDRAGVAGRHAPGWGTVRGSHSPLTRSAPADQRPGRVLASCTGLLLAVPARLPPGAMEKMATRNEGSGEAVVVENAPAGS